MSTDTASKATSGLKVPSKISRPVVSGLPKPTALGSSAATASSSSISSLASAANQPPPPPSTPVRPPAPPPSQSTADYSNENPENLKVNDRVWLNGVRSGTIAYIGETQFKEGLWVGVILDTPDGKNNGTVMGVKYFEADENRGIFCRMDKLSRTQQQQETPATNDTTLRQESASSYGDLVVGDRVIVTTGDTAKIGTLRYLGPTDFAKGDWAGVELEQKLGKNDGSVAGKRYFQCEPLYGVFTPVTKCLKYTGNETKVEGGLVNASPQVSGSRTSLVSATPSGTRQQIPQFAAAVTTMAAAKSSSGAKLSKQLSGSQESIASSTRSSIYSTASAAVNKQRQAALNAAAAAATPKTKIASAMPSSTPPNLASTGNTAASIAKKPTVSQPVLQQSLREKENHIAQLLKERDFERAEFTRAAQKFEETETRLSEYTKLLDDKNEEIKQLSQLIESLKESKNSLMSQHEEDKSRIEDLEFQIEEQKLGVSNLADNSTAADDALLLTNGHSKAVIANQEEESMVLKQLQLQQEMCKNHLEEAKILREQTDTLNVELKQLKLGEEVHSQEKKELKKQVEELETQLNAMKTEIANNFKLKEQVKVLESKVRSADEENGSQLEKLKADLGSAKSALQQAETQKSDLEFLYEETQVKLGELTTKLQDKERQIDALNQGSNDKTTDAEFALEEQMVLYQELEAKFNSLNAEKSNEIAELQSQINRLKEAAAKIEVEKDARISSLEKTIQDSSENLGKNNTEMSSLGQELIEKEKLLKSAQTEIDSLKSQKLQEIEALNNKIKEMNDSSMASIKSLNEKCHILEANLEESKKSNAELQNRISEFIKNSGDNSIQLTSLNEKLVEKEKLIENLQSSVNSAQQEIETLKEQNASLTRDNSDQIQALKSKQIDLETKLQASEKENQSLDTKLAALTEESSSKLEKANNVKEELEKKIKELLNSSENSSSQFNTLNEMLQDKEKQIQTLESKVHQTEQEQQASLKQLEAAQAKLREAEEALQAKEKEISTLSAELRIAKEDMARIDLEQKQEIESKNDLFKAERASLLSENDGLIKKLATLQMQLEKGEIDATNRETEFKSQEAALKEKLAQLQSEQESLKNAQRVLLQEKEKHLAELEQLKSTLSNTDATDKLKAELSEAQKKISILEENEQKSLQEHETNIRDLQDLIKENEDIIETKNQEIEKLSSDVTTQKDIIDEFERENEELRNQVANIRSSGDYLLNNNHNQSQYEEQIETLQSTIQELQAKVQYYEQQLKSSSTTEKTSAFKHATEVKVAPRLYCDICDEFDLHETEDCPRQSMTDTSREQDTHTHYNYSKESNRDYCDVCEQFGHDDDNCPKKAVRANGNGHDQEEF